MSNSLANTTFLKDRLQVLHRENANQLITVLINYDEMNTILTAVGHDTTALHCSIKSALESSVELIAHIHEHMTKFNLDREAEGLR